MDSYLDPNHVPKRQRSIRKTLLYTTSVACSILVIAWLYTSSLRIEGGLPEILVFPREAPPVVEKAFALLTIGSAHGTINFTQSGGDGPVTVSGTIQDLYPALHGFHVHETGDLSNQCNSAGAHYNPFGYDHGAPTDQIRHVGDLGNIESNGSGVAVFSFTDDQISLNGPYSILGRAIVVHAGKDDLGTVDNDGSRTTGNSGPRLACGVIEISV